jgi:hypothetical protein
MNVPQMLIELSCKYFLDDLKAIGSAGSNSIKVREQHGCETAISKSTRRPSGVQGPTLKSRPRK